MADVIYTDDKTKILSGNPLNFYTPRSQRIRSLKVYFSPKQEGGGTPSPDNIRPITGWTGVEVGHCGKNLFDKTKITDNSLIDSTGAIVHNASWFVTDYIPVIPNTIVSCFGTRRANTTYNAWYDSNKKLVSVIKQDSNMRMTVPTNARYIRCSCAEESLNQFQIECGEATDYEPYKTKLSIPKEYQEVEYLESDGNQYIKTDVMPAQDLPFHCKFLVTDHLSPGFGNVFGSRGNSGVREYQLTAYNSGTVSVGTRNSSLGFSPNKINIVDFDGDTTATINGTEVTIATSEEQHTQPLTLFGICQSTSHGYQLQAGKIYELSFGDVANFIPCYRKSDKVAGMYDTVSKKLYTNSGTGEFTVGPAVNPQSIDWSEEVGTVYGGYVDLVSGELVETYGKIELTGEENLAINPWNGNGVYWQVRETSYDTTKIPFMNGQSYGNILPYYNNGYYPKTDGCFTLMGAGTIPNYTYLMLYNSNWGTTVEEYKSALKELYDNGTPLTIVAPLKTVYHQTHQLSPATLSTLMFDNNFWSNADRIEIEYDYIGVFKPLTSRKNIMSGTPHLETAKDSIISFGTDMAANLKECKVYFKPKQDLHGYGKPWIGGTGKNLLDVSNYRDGYYIDNNGVEQSYALFGYTTSYTPVTAGEVYTLSGNVGNSASAYAAIYYYDDNKEFIGRNGFKSNTVPYTFTVIENAKYVNVQYYASAKLDTVMLEKGSTATEYEPYENVCPIEGWDSITITICGKNLYNYENIGYYSNVNGKYVNNSDYSYWRIKVKEGDVIRTAGGGYGVGCYFKDGKWVKKASGNTYTVPSGVDELTNNFTHSNMYENIVTRNNPDMSYEPYQGVTLTIEFPKTIYGGYVDLVKGEIVEEYNMIDLSTIKWLKNYYPPSRFFAWLLPGYKGVSKNVETFDGYCDTLSVQSMDTASGNSYITMRVSGGNGWIVKTDGTQETVPSGNLCMRLTTQNTYPITPQTLTTLRDANTIWSNSNDKTEITYYKHEDLAYQHIPTSDAITSNDDFLIVSDDGYVIGTEDDFITY